MARCFCCSIAILNLQRSPCCRTRSAHSIPEPGFCPSIGTVLLHGDTISSLGTWPSVHQGQPLAQLPMTGSGQVCQGSNPLLMTPRLSQGQPGWIAKESSGLRDLSSRPLPNPNPPSSLVVILVSLGTVSRPPKGQRYPLHTSKSRCRPPRSMGCPQPCPLAIARSEL